MWLGPSGVNLRANSGARAPGLAGKTSNQTTHFIHTTRPLLPYYDCRFEATNFSSTFQHLLAFARSADACLHQLNLFAYSENFAETLLPKNVTAVIATIAMKATRIPYSARAAPSSSATKFVRVLPIRTMRPP